MKANVFKITAIMLVVAVIGCDKSTETEMYKDIDSEINIRMWEVLSNSPRTLQMHFETTKIYPCVNFPIILSWQKSSNVIDVVFEYVMVTDFCFTALGPATATIDFGTLSNGTYQLNFQNGGIKYSGELIVSSDSYTINFPANSAFNFTNSPLNKIPEHTIWGRVSYHAESTRPLVQDVFAALMKLGAEERSFTPGRYNSFEVDDNGNIICRGSHGHRFSQRFMFYYSGSSSELVEFIRQWEPKRNYITIEISTCRGEFFWRGNI